MYISLKYFDSVGGASGMTRMDLADVPAWLSEHPGHLIHEISFVDLKGSAAPLSIYMRAGIAQMREALAPFAEDPAYLDEYTCHHGICTKEKCGRCSRAIAAWNAYHAFSEEELSL